MGIKFLNRIIPWSVPVLVLIFLEQSLATPKQIYWLAPLCLGVIILAIWQLIDRSFYNKKFWQLLITPALLFASGLLFFSFLEGYLFQQAFLLVLVILIWAFLQVIFLMHHSRPHYQPYALENIIVHLNLIIIFFTAASFFSLIVFLGISLGILLVIFYLVTFLLAYQLLWVSGTTFTANWPYAVIITIVLTEIFWAVSFLPTSVYVNGLVLAISYYLIAGLTRNWLLEIKEKKVVRRYLLISILVFIITMLTAKWF